MPRILIFADLGAKSAVAFIDGSFDKTNKVVGTGGVIFYEGKKKRFHTVPIKKYIRPIGMWRVNF